MQRERYSQELQRNIKATRSMEWLDVKDKVGLQTVCCVTSSGLQERVMQLLAALQQVAMRTSPARMQTHHAQVIKVTLGTAIFPVRYGVAHVPGRLSPGL
jgi:hypothetical protein